MPRQSQWFQHLPAALDALREFHAPVVDRAGVEQLLRVSRRSAIRLMNDFGGYQAGRTFLIGRDNLIHSLEAAAAGEAYQFESRRRQRLSDDLERIRSELRAKQVKLSVAPDPIPATSLPFGMRLVLPGVLEVEFASAEDLLARLYKLVQMAGKDFDRLTHALNAVGSTIRPQ